MSRHAARPRAVRRVTREAMRLILTGGVPLYGAVFVGVRPLLQAWLRGALQPGQPEAFRIMLAGSFLSLLGTVPYFSLLGLHRSREVVTSYVVQSALNVAAIAGAWLSTGAVPLSAVLVATSAGMGASTLYLAWANREAVASIAPLRQNP